MLLVGIGNLLAGLGLVLHGIVPLVLGLDIGAGLGNTGLDQLALRLKARRVLEGLPVCPQLYSHPLTPC